MVYVFAELCTKFGARHFYYCITFPFSCMHLLYMWQNVLARTRSFGAHQMDKWFTLQGSQIRLRARTPIQTCKATKNFSTGACGRSARNSRCAKGAIAGKL